MNRKVKKIIGWGCVAGCGTFLLGIGVVGFFFFYIVFLFFSAEDSGQWGAVNQVLESEEAFYSIRGEWDYSRVPLRRPYDLKQMERNGEITLGSNNLVVLSSVEGVTYSNGYFVGETSASSPEGKQWFVIAPDGTLSLFDTIEKVRDFAHSVQVEVSSFTSADELLRTFGRTGNGLPLFDVETLRIDARVPSR